MKKVRVKTKTVKDKELAGMFNQMLGADNVNVGICYPRYVQIRGYIEKVVQVLDLFNSGCKFYESFPELTPHNAEIATYLDGVRKTLDQYKFELPADADLSKIDAETTKQFGVIYNDFKKCETVSTLVIMCDGLIAYKKHIGDAKTLNHKFIAVMPGVEFCPFPFTRLNFKYVINAASSQLANNNTSSPMIDLVLTVLNKVLSITHNLYKLISTPDVDIDEFVEVVLRNIEEARKRIPRCDKAFNKLVTSVEMLKSNFPGYFRDFAQSSNSTVIIENFVLDVAKNTKADPELMRQFRSIIKFYKQMSANQVKNPQVQGLLDKINEQFAKFDKYANLNNSGKCDTDATVDIEDSSDEEPTAGEYEEERAANAEKSVDELVAEIMGATSGKK